MVKLAICVLLTGVWSALACAEIKAGTDKGLAAVNRLDRDSGYNNNNNRHRGHHETMEEAKSDDEEDTGANRKRARVVVGSEDNDQEGAEETSRKSSSQILRELRQLRESVNGLKTQSNLLYKQLKSLHKSCASSNAASMYDSTSSSSSQSSSSSSSSSTSTLLPTVSLRPDESGAMNNAIQSDALLMNPDPKSNPCPPYFTYFPDYNGCFRLSAERVTWRTARERCLAMNSDLATVESSRKQRVLIENAKTSPDTRHCDFWIGLSRRGSSLAGDWRWAAADDDDDAPLFTNWNYNEPNNGKGNEHCVQMLWIFHWKWNDAPCNYGNACYICQAKPYA